MAASPIRSQMNLDDHCVVSALNRSTRVLDDGSWVLPNVPTNFGLIRVRANCVDAGMTRSGQSDFVRLPPGGSLRVSDIAFHSPRPIPQRLALRAPRTLLGAAGESVQLEAVATFADGVAADVTPSSAGTNYRSSNPAVAAVDEDGTVTAISSGTVLVSATHEGALGLIELRVVAGADTDGDGLPDDFEVANGLDPSNGADAQLDQDRDGLSTGDEFRRGLDPFDPDTDGDGLDDGRESLVLGTDALRFDTDGDGLSDGLELDLGTDPLDATSFDYASALVGLEVRPALFSLVFDTVLGDTSTQLTVIGALRDGTSIDLTAPSRGTTYLSSDLAVCRLGAEPGLVFAGQPGECAITVTSGGRSAAALGIVQTFSPKLLASLPIPGSVRAIAVAGDHAFIAAGDSGLQIVDVANRRVPQIAASIPTSGTARDVAVADGLALVAAGSAGLDVIDVTVPRSPRRLATVPLGGTSLGVAFAGEIAVVAMDPNGVTAVDVSNPSVPVVLGTASTASAALAVAVDDGAAIAVVAEGPLGVEVIDLGDRARPVGRGRAATGDARAVTLAGGYALVADAVSSFTVVDVRDPWQPLVVASVPRELGGIPLDVARFESLAFTADLGFFADDAVPIFDVADPSSPLARSRLPLTSPDQGRGIDADDTYVYLVACAGCDGASPHSHLDIGQYRSLQDGGGLPPQVALTSPRDGDVAMAGSTLEIAADASDDVGVLAVEFLVDGRVAGRDERPAFGMTIRVPEDATRLTLGARAYDFALNRAVAEEIEVVVVRAGTTTLTGVVVDPRDEPVVGARVIVGPAGASPGSPPVTPAVAITGPGGVFAVADLAVGGATPIVAQASAAVTGRKHHGSSAPVLPVVGGETSVGVIRLEPIDVLYPGPRTFTGSTANGMALADFDRDGIDDLAVAHASSANGVAIHGGERDGRFTLRQRVAATGGVFAGDLALDGAPDLLAVGRDADGVTHRLVLLRNTGDGSFEVGASRVVSAAPSDVRIADVDGDGLLDVLFTSRAPNAVVVLLGNGDGTLRSETSFPLDGSPEDIATGDWNLDGRLDVAVAVTRPAAPHAVLIVLGNGPGGLATYGALSFSLAPLALTAGDFDGDGVADLVVGAGRPSDTQKAFLALGHGDGSFALASTAGSSILASPLWMAADDLDGDGALDLAIARDRSPCDDILLLRGDGTGSFLLNEPRSITDTCALPRFVTSDLTGDSLPEVVVLDDSGVTTYLATGGVGFERRRDLVTTTRPDELATHDFDRDGRLDLVYSFQASKSLGVQLGNGDGTFRTTAGLLTSIFIHQLAPGDVNRDGIADLVVSSLDEVGTLLGRGDGTFAAPVLLPIPRALSSLVVTDLSGDGTADVVATNDQTDELLVFESRGDGTLEAASASPVGDTPRAMVLAHLDHDGILDAAVLNFFGDDVSILLGTGFGRFAPQARFPVRNDPDSIAAADFDLDGAVDLVIGGHTSTPPLIGTATVVMGDGEGSFGPPIAIESASSVTRVAAADVDLDGVPDLILLHATDDLSVLLGVGDGTFLPAERTRTGQGPSRIAIVDVDGDGEPDLVTTNIGTSRPGISVMLHR